jgi:hypothetical protein
MDISRPGSRPLPTFKPLEMDMGEVSRQDTMQNRPFGSYGFGSNGYGMSLGSNLQLGSNGHIGIQF